MKLNNKYIVLDICSEKQKSGDIFKIAMTCIENDAIVFIKSININQDLEYNFDNVNNNSIRDDEIKQPVSIVDFFKTLGSCQTYYYCDTPQTLSSADDGLDFGLLKPRWLDAMQIFKKQWPDETSYDLTTLCKKRKIQSQHHAVGKNSLAIAQLLNLAIKKTHLRVAQKFLQPNYYAEITS